MPTPPSNNELARRLMAACLSYHLRIGLEYALKRYVPEEVPQFWLDLANALDEARRAAINQSRAGLGQTAD